MKKLIPIGLLSAIILVGCGDGEDRQLRYMERAQKFLAEENFDKARIDARNVLQINPKNLEARILLANIAYEEGDLRKAYGNFMAVYEEDENHVGANSGLAKVFTNVREFEAALKHTNIVLDVDAGNEDMLGYKAVALAGLGRKDEAQDVAQAALQINAGNAAALGVLSQYLVARGKSDEALKLIDGGISLNADDDRLVMMKIAILENAGRTGEIESELVKLTKKHPDSANYSNALVRYYIRDARFEQAEEEVRLYVINNPDSLEAKRRLISYLRQHATVESAIEQADTFIKEEPDQLEHRITLARLYLFTGDRDNGVKVLEQTIDTDPRSVAAIEARNMIAQMELADQDYDAASVLINEVLDIEPENEEALLRRAGLYLKDNQLEEGIADLRVVLKNNPENAAALSGLARAQEASGRERLALDNYKKLMTLQQPDVNTLASAARLAIKSEQYPDAERFIRSALEQDAENASLVTNLIRLLALKEDWDEAETFSDRLVESEESKALGYYLKAGINLQLEDKQAALGNLNRSIEANPGAVESLAAKARLVSELQGVDAAINDTAKHCDAHQDQAHCRYILGSLYAQNRQFGEAEAELNRAIQSNEKLVPAYLQLAKVHAAQEQLDSVEKVLKQGIGTLDSNKLRFELAAVYYGTGNYEAAAQTYDDIVNSDSSSLAAKNNLAMIYAENIGTAESLKKARSLIVDLQENDNPAYLDTVGWVMYLNGEYEQSLNYLRAAVDKVGSSPLLQYHLGMAYFKNDQLELAKEHLTLATAGEARYPGYDQAVETLQSL